MSATADPARLVDRTSRATSADVVRWIPRTTPPILQVVAVVLAGWLKRLHQRVLEYLQEENRDLKRQLRDRRLRLTGVPRDSA